MNPPEDLINILKKEDNFLILTHSTPDGDALGSCLALKFFLEKLNKKVEIFAEKPIPLQYRFLPGIDYIKDLKEITLKNLNVLILVDCNKIKRVSYEREILKKIESFNGKTFVIDHHIIDDQDDNRSIKWIDPQKAATGILIYNLIKSMKGKITEEIAVNLYTAIIVDTGNFQFDNTTEEVFSIATELVKAGAKPSYIYQQCFESWRENRFKLFIRMLNNLEILPPLALSYISKSDFQDTNTKESDTERFVEFLRILNDINLTVLFREIETDLIKVSLRSKGDIDVSLIAREFGGGGHKNAAGYRTKGSLKYSRNQLIKKLKKYNLL
ncbi:MAG: bifunctional oligoribonuclease/PAP phosphatase NrnA [Thermodesulfovibrio sp.]|nr:bifunctional oligoribonuclease/PAP phosphatase NrnA [Thermodesulfovibrio sp.]